MAKPRNPAAMQILALGMPRTGTMSMRQALERLGYSPAYHGTRDLERTAEKKHFEHQKLSLAELERLFHGHMAVTDMCFLFWEDLLDAYPEAKLILVERDLESWFHSFNRALMPIQFTWTSTLFKHIVEPLIRTKFVRMGEMMQLSFFDSASQQDFRANARDKYRQYYSDVRAAAKARGRTILEYELGSGWQPLCEFLGRLVPDVPFPKANEEAAILKFWSLQFGNMMRRFGVALLWYIIPLLFSGLGLWLYYHSAAPLWSGFVTLLRRST